MNLYYCKDTDSGNATYIVANNIKEAIDTFEKKYQYEPETIQLMNSNNPVLFSKYYLKDIRLSCFECGGKIFTYDQRCIKCGTLYIGNAELKPIGE